MENLITIEMIDDWAGAAMQGLIAAQGQNKAIELQIIAKVAYKMATEMAKARGEFIEAYGADLADSESDMDTESEEDDGLS